MLSAYQEELLSLEQLRERMPRSDSANKRCAPSCKRSPTKPTIGLLSCAWRRPSRRSSPDYAARPIRSMSLSGRRIVRLVVKEVLIGDDTITIRHSIPVPSGPRKMAARRRRVGPKGAPGGQSYLLRKGSDGAGSRESREQRHAQPVHCRLTYGERQVGGRVRTVSVQVVCMHCAVASRLAVARLIA